MDLLIEIKYALQTLPGVSLKFVKGHQDRRRRYEALSLLAQLNIDADDLATHYQNAHGRALPFALMTPHTAAYLVYPEGTVTAKYTSELRHRATSPALTRYIKDKNGWSDGVMEVVNWSAHGKAIKAQLASRIHVIKVVHECLPTTGQQNRRDNGTRKCPTCDSITEDRDHIIRCDSPTRSEWREKFRRSASEFHREHETAPELLLLWNLAMDQWLAVPDGDIVVSLNKLPDTVHTTAIQQNAFGWRQLFNGRFSIGWSAVQEQHYAELRQRNDDGRTDKRNGQQWQRRFISSIWVQWLNLWKQRNQELHGATAAAMQSSARRSVYYELGKLYDQRAALDTGVSAYFYMSDTVILPTVYSRLPSTIVRVPS